MAARLLYPHAGNSDSVRVRADSQLLYLGSRNHSFLSELIVDDSDDIVQRQAKAGDAELFFRAFSFTPRLLLLAAIRRTCFTDISSSSKMLSNRLCW